MLTLLIAFGSIAAFTLAYNTYGRWLERGVFQTDADAIVPSRALDDGTDYVPTRRSII